MMENEPPAIAVHDDGKGSKRGRIMGKLFGRDRDRDRKGSQGAASGDLNDFFHGSGDKLQVSHAAPPMLSKLDTKSISRYPNALQVQGTGNNSQQSLTIRSHNSSPKKNKPNRRGLVLRFAETAPEVMGEGGDICEVPTIEISKRRRARPPPSPVPPRPTDLGNSPRPSFQGAQASPGTFDPAPLRRTQTGFSTTSDSPDSDVSGSRNTSARLLGNPSVDHDERRRSFIEIQQAEMREAEGQAFVKAVRAASGDGSKWDEGDAAPPTPSEPEPASAITASPEPIQTPRFPPQPSPNPPSSAPPPIPTKRQRPHPSPLPPPPPEHAPPPYTPTIPQTNSPERLKQAVRQHAQSPVSLASAASSFQHPFVTRQGSKLGDHALPATPQMGGSSFQDVVAAAADDAMVTFVERIRHLFELFRLHAESVRPLLSCAPNELARAALWWFLTGRMALENAIRDRPSTPESQMKNEICKQQAYTDLAKGYWLLEEIMPEILNSGRNPVDREAEDVRTSLASSLRKLSVSMKRNGFLPPEEPFLPQTLDRTIWLEYPQLPGDIKSMLWGSSSLALSQSQLASSGMSILETLPLGDSSSAFCFGRFQVSLFLMEKGRESQRIHLPCYVSIVRPQTQPDILFVIASQNGAVQLRISGNESTGPVWKDVRWRPESCTLEVGMPRGFVVMIQCSQQAFQTLRSMYEFSNKVHSSLYPKQDEACVFRLTLRSFQYFDNDPQARQFPKEPAPNCEVAMFERLLKEGAATGPRTYHRDFRIAVITGPRTKTLSGVNQIYNPETPIRFGFLRSDNNEPSLSLRFENGRFKGNMVMSFADEKERARMHTLLIGTSLHREESIFCESALKGAWVSERFGDSQDGGLTALSNLNWNKVRVINQDTDGDRPANCVLSDKLRIIFEFKDGTLTDRVNVAPGELKLRLDVHNPSCMMVFRQPQVDITLAVSEANVSSEVAQRLAKGLDTIRQRPTIRTIKFAKLEDLHTFETAITGFKVLFDGIAATFAISRRRMVVPIHKKWEAGATRIQVVQQDGITQILAFFSDFSHGQCMGFSLKGTDVFESFGKQGKAGLKIVDAKFPLPKLLQAGMDGAQEAADVAFLCLDLPELPGEHDDISIVFEDEAERDKLAACLPAPVKGGSRLIPKIKSKE
ncbi:hypothetical protein QBC40DRAFT_42261 [Triangularia verruculosa]|uniref:Uncharacterized protein n=1 Tax=Triangularia verruculosa TaxID=2587418 RepID=A0AAN6XKN8_9PEZI|nr:hypothetical protein QBC40DRAFT_42261 [Triangularia verruculosa]